ncbi:Ribonuclease 3 [Phycisphaerales bacterium]|nr:Ribonuclease 3 [Phycisphaerales bacterium]
MDSDRRHNAEFVLGYHFRDPALLERALTHTSTTDNGLASNERLEFLGDAVLGMIVCELIYTRFPSLREGEMTKIKSAVVSRDTCAHIARDLGLENLLMLGKGMQTNGTLPPSLSACALESVIGAIYLDAGWARASEFVRTLVEPIIERSALSGHQENFKSVLQQYAQQHFNRTPNYRVLDEQGPDHAKCFKVRVEIGGRCFEPCWGQTKKKAEQLSALATLRDLGLVREKEGGELVIEIPAE